MADCPSPERLQALADPTLAADAREALNRHAETCAACRAAIVALFRDREATRDAATDGAAPDEISGTQATVAAPGPSATAAAAAMAPGATVGRYVIEGRLGAGAMGVVYAARDPELDRAVAIKLLRPGHDGDLLRTRLYREAQALARVAHPNVVAVHDVGTHDGQVFITMELVRGVTLRTWLGEGRPWREALAMMLAAGRGLAAAHAAGLVHRDVKPDNVLVGDDGRARVTDFGLARAALAPPSAPAGAPPAPSPAPPMSPLYATMTATGTFLGTPAYAAPEQLDGLDSDAQADQFGFCVATWEALYGRRPFVAGSLDELMTQIRGGVITPPPPGRAVPTAIRRALERGLAVSPAARFPSMDALLRALDVPRRRRALGLAAGLAALALGGAAVTLATRTAAGPACAGLDAPLTGVWDDGVRAAVERTFLASGQPQAAARFALVRRTLDGFAGRWREMREEACRATHDRGDQSAAAMAARMSCLDDRLAELGALTRALAAADANVVDHAPAAALQLSAIATCRSPGELGAVNPPAPAIAAEVRALEVELHRAGQVAMLNRAVEAQPILDAARLRAEALGYAPLLAEVHHVAGAMAWTAGNHHTATTELRLAVQLAERARFDRLKAESAIALVRVLVTSHELDEAERVAELADATLARIGGDPDLASQLELHRGVLAVKRGDAAAALPRFQRVLDARSAAGDNPLGVASVLLELSTAYANLGRNQEAAAALDRAEPIWRAYYGDTSEGAMNLLASQSLQALFQGDVRRSNELGERALHMAEVLRPTPDLDRATLEAGMYTGYAIAEEWAPARRHVLRAAELHLELGEPVLAASDFEFAGRASRELGDLAAAIAHYERSIALVTSIASPEAAEQLTYSRSGLGATLVEAGQDVRAVVELEWALPRLDAIEPRPRGTTGGARFALARALWGRAATGDGARARGLLDAAREDLVGHHDSFDAQDPMNVLIRGVTERQLQKLDAWRAQRMP